MDPTMETAPWAMPPTASTACGQRSISRTNALAVRLAPSGVNVTRLQSK